MARKYYFCIINNIDICRVDIGSVYDIDLD
jgi:hypothetical protein